VASNRDSSKQKRARQNRAQREAREARAKAASVPASERQAKYATASPSASSKDAAPRKKGFFGGGDPADRPARRVRPGDVPVDLDTLEGSWYSKRMQVPGGRQVLTGTVLTLILTVLTLITPVPTADKNDPKDATESIFDVLGAATIPVVAVPLLAMLVASWFIISPHRRRIWIGCAVVSVIGVSLLGIQYVFPVGFLIYGVMRANKIDGPTPNSRAGRAPAASEASEVEAAGAGADDDTEIEDADDDTSAEGVAERRSAED